MRTASAPLRIDFGGGWTDVEPYASAHGARIFNAAITARVIVTEDSVVSPVATGSGLGASGAINLAKLALKHSGSLEPRGERILLAKEVYRAEHDAGEQGGWQDQYAAALGGFNFISGWDARPVAISDQTRKQLEERIVLSYTGEARISGDIHKQVISSIGTTRILQQMAYLAEDMVRAVEHGSVDWLGRLVMLHWNYQRRLHESICTPTMDSLFKHAMANGAIAGKALGAGGGGYCMLIAGKGERGRLTTALASRRFGVRGFEFDDKGLVVETTGAGDGE